MFDRQKELENKLTEIDFELAAIDAYEAAKTGKAAMPTGTAARSNKERSNDRGTTCGASRLPTAGN